MNRIIIAAVAAALAAGSATAEPQTEQAVTKNLQGEQPVGMDEAIQLLYNVIIEAGAKNGADKVDVAALDGRVRELSHKYAAAHDLTPKQMEDHVVDMSHQMLEIGKKDPKIFDSVENFAVAMRGPN